ncbi:MAG TPA: hypothetical protein VKT78_20600, partial [Fimbriimonadaceae bacterium]|nr:hypothetical protein [Fimbriimonadaceae bacterium]
MIAGILPVRITGTEGHWQLSRHGTPYFIKGAAGSSRLDGLVVAGGNSFRTWGAEQLEQALKDAHARSL